VFVTYWENKTITIIKVIKSRIHFQCKDTYLVPGTLWNISNDNTKPPKNHKKQEHLFQ